MRCPGSSGRRTARSPISEDITGIPSHALVGPGIALSGRSWRIRTAVGFENLLMGAYARNDKAQISEVDEIYTMIPRLKERTAQFRWHASGGEQQMLAIGRAMLAQPKLLMLDEPSWGWRR